MTDLEKLASFPEAEWVVKDRLFIHRRPARMGAKSKPQMWYGRGWFKEGGWKDLGTLGTKDQKEASREAMNRHEDTTDDNRLGIKRTKNGLTALLQEWVESLQEYKDTSRKAKAEYENAKRAAQRLTLYIQTVKPDKNRLERLTSSELESYCEWRKRQPTYRGKPNGGKVKTSDTTSPVSLAHEKTTIRTFLSWCVRQDYIRESDKPQVPGMGKRHHQERRMQHFTPKLAISEWEKLKQAMEDMLKPENMNYRFPIRQRLYREVAQDYITLLVLTGCRPHELYRIQWKDITRKPKEGDNTGQKGSVAILVNERASRRGYAGKIANQRLVGAVSGAYGVLQRREGRAKALGQYGPKKYVFCHPPLPACTNKGTPGAWIARPKNSLDKALVLSGIRLPKDHPDYAGELSENKKVFYSLRHFFITQALRDGMSIEQVAENCGTGETVIRQTYAPYSDTQNVEDWANLKTSIQAF